MELIRLGPGDYERVVELWRCSGLSIRPAGRDSKEAFAHQLASGVQAILAYQLGSELIGAVVTTHDSRKGWINRLAVHPAWQRQGIGTRLIKDAEKHLHDQGIEVIAALIFETNIRSTAAFRKAGYVPETEILYFSKRPNSEV